MKVKELIALLQSDNINPESEVRVFVGLVAEYGPLNINYLDYVMHPAFDECKYVEIRGEEE